MRNCKNIDAELGRTIAGMVESYMEYSRTSAEKAESSVRAALIRQIDAMGEYRRKPIQRARNKKKFWFGVVGAS